MLLCPGCRQNCRHLLEGCGEIFEGGGGPSLYRLAPLQIVTSKRRTRSSPSLQICCSWNQCLRPLEIGIYQPFSSSSRAVLFDLSQHRPFCESAVERRVVQVMFTVPKEKLRVVNRGPDGDGVSVVSRESSVKDLVKGDSGKGKQEKEGGT